MNDVPVIHDYRIIGRGKDHCLICGKPVALVEYTKTKEIRESVICLSEACNRELWKRVGNLH